MPVPYDPASDYVCPCVYLYLYQYAYLCLISNEALGIEEPEYVYAYVTVYLFGANSSWFQVNVSGGGTDMIRTSSYIVSTCIYMYNGICICICIRLQIHYAS